MEELVARDAVNVANTDPIADLRAQPGIQRMKEHSEPLE